MDSAHEATQQPRVGVSARKRAALPTDLLHNSQGLLFP